MIQKFNNINNNNNNKHSYLEVVTVTLTNAFFFFLLLSVVKVVFASHDPAQKTPLSRLSTADHQNLQFSQVTLLLCLLNTLMTISIFNKKTAY